MKYKIALLIFVLIAVQGCAGVVDDGYLKIASNKEVGTYTKEPEPKVNRDPWRPVTKVNENGEEEFDFGGFRVTVPQIHGFYVKEFYPLFSSFVIAKDNGQIWAPVTLYRGCPGEPEKSLLWYRQENFQITDLGDGIQRVKDHRTEPEVVEGLGYAPYYYYKELGDDLMAKFMQQDKKGGVLDKELEEVVKKTKIVPIH